MPGHRQPLQIPQTAAEAPRLLWDEAAPVPRGGPLPHPQTPAVRRGCAQQRHQQNSVDYLHRLPAGVSGQSRAGYRGALPPLHLRRLRAAGQAPDGGGW